jgi:hypothetical protein
MIMPNMLQHNSTLSCSPTPTIALCMYGLVRRVQMTQPSLQRNIHEPLSQTGGTDVFLHTFVTHQVTDAGGQMSMLADSASFLGTMCAYTAEDQDSADAIIASALNVTLIHTLARRPKPLGRQYSRATVFNLLRAAYSLHKVASMAKAQELKAGGRYRLVAVVRPDTAVLTALPQRELQRLLHPDPATANAPPDIIVPNFHHWGGVNDRLAFGKRHAMIDVHMQRWGWLLGSSPKLRVADLMIEQRAFPNSEGILCDLLRSHRIRIRTAPLCIVRVRMDGTCNRVDFAAVAEELPLRAPCGRPNAKQHLAVNPDGTSTAGPCHQHSCDTVSV